MATDIGSLAAGLDLHVVIGDGTRDYKKHEVLTFSLGALTFPL
jgi:hypothetical protein